MSKCDSGGGRGSDSEVLDQLLYIELTVRVMSHSRDPITQAQSPGMDPVAGEGAVSIIIIQGRGPSKDSRVLVPNTRPRAGNGHEEKNARKFRGFDVGRSVQVHVYHNLT
jgi:hypothetical protein